MENRKLPKLDLNITNQCNFRCIHCAFDSGILDMKEISLKKIKKILKDTKEIGGERFDITGGEPLLRKDLEKIMIIGKKLGYRIELVTNGSLLTNEKLRIFKKIGLEQIAISLDGSNSKVYNKIRKKDKKTFNTVIKNIKLSKKLGFYTKINTTVFTFNLNDIPNIIKLALKLKVDEIGLYYFTPIGRGKLSSKLPIEPIKWLDFIRKKLKKYENKGLRITIEFPFVEKKYLKQDFGCIANKEKSHLQILPSGNVFPCAILASYNKPIANLNNTSIKNIWKNKKLWDIYWRSLSDIFDTCNGCCVDFKESFNIKRFNSNKYNFICPLRKFKLGEIK